MARQLSIEIGLTTTKIVEMDYQSKKPKVYKCIEIPTPPDTIDDGYLIEKNIEVLKDAIKEALKENKIYTKRVLFTVFSGKIITREITLPGVKDHQINAVIESNITEYFPIELDEYKIAHIKIETLKEGNNAGKHKVVVIAAEEVLINEYEKLAELLNLNIVDVDYAGNSMFQAVKHSAGKEAIMVVKVEKENTIITIVRQGTMILQRNVNYNIGYRPQEDQVTMLEAAQTLVGTLLRIIDFFMSNNEDSIIEKIYIMGEGSKDHDIINMVQEQTQISTQPLEIVRGVSFTKYAQDCQVNVFGSAIGAGISSVGFDKEKEKERHETNYVSASLLMIVLIVVLVVTELFFSLIPYNMALTEQSSLQKKQLQLEPAKVVYDQYNGMKTLIEKVRYGQALTHNSNDSVLDFLAELEEILPTDVEVSDFSSDDTQCVISMRVSDKETAAGIINKFREFESLSSVTVTEITEETADNEVDDDLSSDNKLINFTITAEYSVQTLTEPASTSATTTSDTTSEDVLE